MTARGFAFIVSRAMAVYLFIGILNVLPMNISAVASVRNAGAEAWLPWPCWVSSRSYTFR